MRPSPAVILCLLLAASAARATDYHVGPGQTYTNIGDVPWESLAAGDTVFIHARPTPYAEKWVINAVGTASAPITVRGVPDANNTLPVITGQNATTRKQLNFWNEERGVIKIGGSNSPPDGTPAHIVVENLHIQKGRGTWSFTGQNGVTQYGTNAAAIYVEKGTDITIRGCEIEDNGNGLFVASGTTNMVIEGNYIHGNGNPNSIYEHNTYTEAKGILYQFNRFAPLCPGCPGNNLKDRSSGTVVRYNWIEGGNRELDLVDSTDSNLVSDVAYHTTFVYGNVLIKQDGGNSQVAHFGGDSGTTANYRGTLYLWNNTVVSTRSTNTTLILLDTKDQFAEVKNNILYAAAGGTRFTLNNSAGKLYYGGNWLRPGFSPSSETAGTVMDVGGNVTGDSPGFVDEAAQDYHLAVGSGAIDKAAALPAPAGYYPLTMEYVVHQQSRPRPSDAALDIGAFEYEASTQAPDGGVAGGGPDAGLGMDGGTGIDGGLAADGGTGPGVHGKGCGCSMGTGSSALALGLLALLARHRRARVVRTPVTSRDH